MSKRTTTEADRQQAIFTWLSAAQVARIYFADAEDPEHGAVSASTIMRWNDDPDHWLYRAGVDMSKPGAGKRLILFQPATVEKAIRQRVADAA